MNPRQIQWQLHYLGFLDREGIDGQWGPKSMEAAKAFQQHYGLVPDAIFGPRSESASRQAIAALQARLWVPADGLAGPETQAATVRFQQSRNLSPTGQADAPTRAAMEDLVPDFWDTVPNFTREEFRCQCGRFCDGYPAQPREAMVRLAQAARDHFDRPARVVSGLRCRQHNANVGGVADSQHMYGEACDLWIPGVSADDLLAFFQGRPGVRYAYKINGTNVHFDIPKEGR